MINSPKNWEFKKFWVFHVKPYPGSSKALLPWIGILKPIIYCWRHADRGHIGVELYNIRKNWCLKISQKLAINKFLFFFRLEPFQVLPRSCNIRIGHTPLPVLEPIAVRQKVVISELYENSSKNGAYKLAKISINENVNFFALKSFPFNNRS